MYRKQILFRLSVILGILGLATLVGCDLNNSTETFSEEEVVEMMAADLASEGGEMSTLDDISNSPPETGSFSHTETRDGTYVDAHRTYDLTIAEVSSDSDDYTIEGTVTGSADRPRIDSEFSSETHLTATDWVVDGATFTVNGTVSRNGTIKYESLFRDATGDTQSNVTYTYQDVVFTDNSDPTAIGGTLIAEGSFIHEANRVFGKRLVEWSGTVVFEFAEGTVTAHVEDSSSSYTVNLGAGNDDDLVE